MRLIDLIVIHCSATPNGRWTTAADIDGWHQARGFRRDPAWRERLNPSLAAIGYHHIIYTNGALATGRAHSEIGAHAAGNNRTSLGICMVGTDKFSAAQWRALGELIDLLRKQYPRAKICGHRDLSPDKNNDGRVEPWEWLKTCPGFDVAGWLINGKQPLPKSILEV